MLWIKFLNTYLKKQKIKLSDYEFKFVIFYSQKPILDFVYKQFQKHNYELSYPELFDTLKDPKIQNILIDLKKMQLQQQFETQMLTLQELGSYLSNFLLTQDQLLKTNERLDIVKLLMVINKTLLDQTSQPYLLTQSQNEIIHKFKESLETLNYKELKKLLTTSSNPDLTEKHKNPNQTKTKPLIYQIATTKLGD